MIQIFCVYLGTIQFTLVVPPTQNLLTDVAAFITANCLLQGRKSDKLLHKGD